MEFLLIQAVSEDENGHMEEALSAYADTIELCLEKVCPFHFESCLEKVYIHNIVLA